MLTKTETCFHKKISRYSDNLLPYCCLLYLNFDFKCHVIHKSSRDKPKDYYKSTEVDKI